MSASITETLMALGDFELELDYDEDLVAELEFQRHVLFYWGEEPIYTGVLLRRRIGTDKVTVGGRSLEWWLGLDDDGPLVEDREYLACTNKLSNPGFELGALYWRLGEGSFWAIREQTGEPHAGTWAAAVTGDFAKDDVLASDERFEAEAGNQYTVSARVHRPSGSVGRMRLRTIYEGKFDPPNLVTNGGFASATGWTNVSEFSGDAAVESGHLRMGPTTQSELLSNPGFETGDLTAWADDGSGGHGVFTTSKRSGTYGLLVSAAGASYGALTADQTPPGPAAEAFTVVPGERYRAEGFFLADSGSPPDGETYIQLTQGSMASGDVQQTPKLRTPDASDPAASAWRQTVLDFDINEGKTTLFFQVTQEDHTTGGWHADDFSLRRIRGNTCRYRTEEFGVTPERTYRLLANVTPDAAVQTGTLKAVVYLAAAGRPNISVESPAIDRSDGDGTERLLSWDFTPPSGYSGAQLFFVGTDIEGGSFIVDNVSIVDQDTTTVVYDDLQTTAASYTLVTGVTTAPTGTEYVTVAAVVESEGTGWVIDSVSLERVGTPDVAADIVAELLVDPATDTQLIGEGDITGADTLIYDWRIRNLTNRQALQHLSRSGIVDPVREWRVNPDNTLDWGEADELFVDRTDVVLAEADLVVIGLPEVDENAENQLTRIKVIGAERQLPTGERVLITGEAENDPGTATDWFGEELSRTRLIEDSTVDHADYAAALAAYHAERNADRKQNVTMSVSDWRALGRFAVGDWVYIYKPESGIEDLTNELEHQGHTIYPQQQRVLSRTWRLGAGPFRAEIRASDGSVVDITESVRWEKDTTAQIEVGDLLPEFAADPQGGAAGVQFRRFRGSRAS